MNTVNEYITHTRPLLYSYDYEIAILVLVGDNVN